MALILHHYGILKKQGPFRNFILKQTRQKIKKIKPKDIAFGVSFSSVLEKKNLLGHQDQSVLGFVLFDRHLIALISDD